MPTVRWTSDGVARSAAWHSEAAAPAPRRVIAAGETMTAGTAYRLTRTGTALLWQGGYPGPRHLLRALARRLDRALPAAAPGGDLVDAFFRQRRARAARARVLGRLLVLVEADGAVALRRVPDVRQACREVFGGPAQMRR